MGKPSPPAPDPALTQSMISNSNTLTDIAKEQAGHATQLFQETFPGLQTAEDFYQTLASGDPAAIMRAIAPTAQAATQSAEGAKRNIMANTPSGGEKNLALEATDIPRESIISSTASGASMGAPNALASLAGQGVGESIGAAGTASSGLGTANQGLGDVGNMQLKSAEIQAQEKGNVLGGVGGALGDVTQLATSPVAWSAMF